MIDHHELVNHDEDFAMTEIDPAVTSALARSKAEPVGVIITCTGPSAALAERLRQRGVKVRDAIAEFQTISADVTEADLTALHDPDVGRVELDEEMTAQG